MPGGRRGPRCAGLHRGLVPRQKPPHAPIQVHTTTKRAQDVHWRVPSAKKLAQHGKNSSVLGYFRRTGQKMSRVLRRHSKQGEFSRADHHTLATQRTPTVQNSPGTQRVRPQPVQNSPSIAKNAHFGPFDASREKIIPVETQTTDAGRTFSRRPPHTSHAAHTHGTKLSGHAPTQAPTGTKLSPHSKKRPFRPF